MRRWPNAPKMQSLQFLQKAKNTLWLWEEQPWALQILPQKTRALVSKITTTSMMACGTWKRSRPKRLMWWSKCIQKLVTVVISSKKNLGILSRFTLHLWKTKLRGHFMFSMLLVRNHWGVSIIYRTCNFVSWFMLAKQVFLELFFACWELATNLSKYIHLYLMTWHPPQQLTKQIYWIAYGQVSLFALSFLL